MYQIARLAKDAESAYQNKEVVADLITRRAARKMSDKEVKEAVDAILGTGKVSGAAPEVGEAAPEQDAPDAGWWAEICAIKASCSGDEKAFGLLMLERYGK